MSTMAMIGEWVDSLMDWADAETNEVKSVVKAIIAGFVDGVLFGCTAYGVILAILGWAMMIVNACKKK